MGEHDIVMSDILTQLHDGSFTAGDVHIRTASLTQETAAPIDEAVREECHGDDDSDDEAGGWKAAARPSRKKFAKPKLRNIFLDVPRTTLIHPRTIFERFIDAPPLTAETHAAQDHLEPFVDPTPIFTEPHATQDLLQADTSQHDGDYIEFQLEDFACYVYKNDKTVPFEMRSLHRYACESGKKHFYFDGVLRVGNTRRHVRRVPFEMIPLGNYEREHSTVGDQIWILSSFNEKKSRPVYYQLTKPSLEYARFFTPFLWVADLAKHVVNFCEELIEHQINVSIRHFKEAFAKWLKKTHKSDPAFLKWYQQRGSNDYRQSIVANYPFIRKEVFSMLSRGDLMRNHLFKELGVPEFSMYKRIGWDPTTAKKHDPVPYTIVTPYVYHCFAHIAGLEQLLKPLEPTVTTAEAINLSWPKDAAEDLRFTRAPRVVSKDRKAMINHIEVGDLISTPPDDEASGTKWTTNRSDKKWFALVQKVYKTNTDERRFDVIWLYQPDDTPCCVAKYPWPNELFMSINHCTCGQPARLKVAGNEVLNVHSVEWFGTPDASTEFFVRQTYTTTTDVRQFITLETSHLKCRHNRVPSLEYNVGDTVLASPSKRKMLEPFELLEFVDNTTARLRRLRRRSDFDSHCLPNELVYTEEETLLPIGSIATRCIVRFYHPGQSIPAPYNRKGAGNAFIITHRLIDETLQPIVQSNRPHLRQGFDPAKREKKLRSLDLFCGGGNFGRGVEDGGAVSAKWANDIKDVAIHTYMANIDNPDDCHPFLGSIDDLLLRGLNGQFSEIVPRPGDVDVVLAGSPCQGFSLLTMNKESLSQAKNRSLVASFASCINFWRPRWGILENVTKIVRTGMKCRENEDYFSQLICALVGMRYQVQIILGDAWSHGDPQQRVRAFLCFAAPGVQLPKSPYPSHSTPDYIYGSKLGKMTNGEPYVKRRLDQSTAFKFVSAKEATADLPDIYDARTETCIPFPDHRLSVPIHSGNLNGIFGGRGRNKRAQLLNIPIAPYGVNFGKACYAKRTPEGYPDMFKHERDAYPSNDKEKGKDNSNSWGRAHPNELYSTITTVCQPTDARVGGKTSHWEQPRHNSIMEVRRAQGVPDSEVLLGTPKEQWAMVGNAVARGISMALGLSLREAWLGTLYETGSQGPGLPVAVAEHEEERLPIPDTTSYVRYGDLGDVDGDGDGVVLSMFSTTDNSRSTSQTPVFEPELGGSRFYSTTPSTSLTDTHIEELNAAGKRPLPRLDGYLSTNTAPKRVRLAEEVLLESSTQGTIRLGGEQAESLAVLNAQDIDDELVLLREPEPIGNDDDELVLLRESEPIDFARAEEQQQQVTESYEENDEGDLMLLTSGPLGERVVASKEVAHRPAIPTYEMNEDDDLVLVDGFGPSLDETQLDAALPSPRPIPLQSASGLTVVRLPSVDLT